MSRGLVKVEGTRVGWGLVHVGRAHLRRRLVQVLWLVVWRLVQVLRLLLLQLLVLLRRHIRPWQQPWVVGSHRLLRRFKILAFSVLILISANLLIFFRVRSGRIKVSAPFLLIPIFNLSFILITGKLTRRERSGSLLLLPLSCFLCRTLGVWRKSGFRFCF